MVDIRHLHDIEVIALELSTVSHVFGDIAAHTDDLSSSQHTSVTGLILVIAFRILAGHVLRLRWLL